MAGPLTDTQRARLVYDALQAASCPLVEGLYLQEADSMLQLLCAPSQHRTEILAWICSSVNPSFVASKAMSVKSKDPNALTNEMALLGQELMLCRAGDLDLIRGDVSPRRQLQFMEQLLTLVPGCSKSAEPRINAEALLDELFADENLPHLTQMLEPTFDPWPVHIKALCKSSKSSSKPCKEDADVAALLQSSQTMLEQLKSECDFLNGETQSPSAFPPSSLRVAACDLQQLMATFCHVYETNWGAYCTREPPSFSKDTDVFRRVHQLLLACNTALDLLNEVSDASACVNEEARQLQMQQRYWRRGERQTLLDQMEELSKRIG